MTNMQTFSFRPRSEEMVRVNAVALTAALLIWLASALGSVLLAVSASEGWVFAYALVTLLAGFIVLFSLKVAKQWEKDRKSTRLNSSHGYISYAVFCLE